MAQPKTTSIIQTVLEAINLQAGDGIYWLGGQRESCNSENNDLSCCTAANPCGLGEGGCSIDAACAGSLVCGYTNCPNGDPNMRCCGKGSQDVPIDTTVTAGRGDIYSQNYQNQSHPYYSIPNYPDNYDEVNILNIVCRQFHFKTYFNNLGAGMAAEKSKWIHTVGFYKF